MQKIYSFFKTHLEITILIAVITILLVASNPAQASSPSTPTDYFVCTPQQVGVFTQRVHVRCAPSAPNNISYFASCYASDSATASRFLSIFTTAKVTGKNVAIYYTASDTSGTSCGCGSSDCRVIWGAEVMP